MRALSFAGFGSSQESSVSSVAYLADPPYAGADRHRPDRGYSQDRHCRYRAYGAALVRSNREYCGWVFALAGLAAIGFGLSKLAGERNLRVFFAYTRSSRAVS